MGELRKATQNLSQDNHLPGRNSDRLPPQQKLQMSRLEQTCSAGNYLHLKHEFYKLPSKVLSSWSENTFFFKEQDYNPMQIWILVQNVLQGSVLNLLPHRSRFRCQNSLYEWFWTFPWYYDRCGPKASRISSLRCVGRDRKTILPGPFIQLSWMCPRVPAFIATGVQNPAE